MTILINNLPDFPKDEDILNCDCIDVCGLSDNDSCIYEERCQALQFEKLNKKINKILNNRQVS